MAVPTQAAVEFDRFQAKRETPDGRADGSGLSLGRGGADGRDIEHNPRGVDDVRRRRGEFMRQHGSGQRIGVETM